MYFLEIKTETVYEILGKFTLHPKNMGNGTYVSAACSCGDIDTGGLSLSVTSVLSLVWLVLIPPSRSVVS